MKKYNKKGFIDAQLFAPIVDSLIGYTWVGNDNLSLSSTFEYEGSFECNGNKYTSISYNADTKFLLYGSWTVYNEGWLSTDAKTIKITGDVDARLVDWLKSNGTLKDATVKAKKFTYDSNSVIVDYAINDSNGNKISDMKTQVDTNTTNIASNTSDITSLKSSKQDTLTSGTNIKTINGNTVLGSGDLTISGGSSSVNPNILINGDFKFNQRLMTSYYGPNVYGPDRWQVMDELAGISSTNDASWECSLEDIETAGEHFIIAQKVENYKSLLDTDVTAHIEYKNLTEDVAGSVYLCISDGVSPTSQVLDASSTSATVTMHISASASQVIVFLKTGTTGLNMSMKVYYIKLEQGTSYTGKYYEDWGSEQIRCQRYYQPVQVLGLSNIPATTTTLLVSAPLITSLRTKPSAGLLFGSRMPSVTGNGATITCNGVSVTNISQSACLLTFNLKTEATLLQLYAITSQCNIALDSEISITTSNLKSGGGSI